MLNAIHYLNADLFGVSLALTNYFAGLDVFLRKLKLNIELYSHSINLTNYLAKARNPFTLGPETNSSTYSVSEVSTSL
jgi:hypothetical protein